jgi:hypothetical protein
MLQSYHYVLVGNPVAPILTAGDKKFAPSRVIELANSIPKERETLKRITLSALLLVGLCVVGGPMAVAQNTSSQSSAADNTADAITDQQLALLRRDIRSIKKQLIAANLTLTDSEATKFWQVYEEYSVDMGKINDTKTAIIKEYSDEYGTLTDDQADNLIRRWLDTDIEQTKLRQRYVAIFRRVLPGKKAATFFQLDRRIQHDDRCAAYIAASSGPEPGLNFLVEKHHARDRETKRADRFCTDKL